MAGIISFLSFCVRISLHGKFISHWTADKHLGSEKAIGGAERGQGAGHSVISFAGKGGYVGVEGARERKRLLGKRWESHSAVLPHTQLNSNRYF